MRRIERLRGLPKDKSERSSMSFQTWADSFKFNGNTYGLTGLGQPVTTWGKDVTEAAPPTLDGYASHGFAGNGVVFAVIARRLALFTEARFQWQRMEGGRPADLFGTPALSLLEVPWSNGTTGDLLARMELDVSLAGNFYAVRRGNALRRLRPDLVSIIVGSHSGDPIDAEPVGYLWWPEGMGKGTPIRYLPEDVVHFAPIPDPTASYRGMSWLTPVVEEVRADTAATRHKGKFFDNAATPNLAVSLDKALAKKDALDFIEAMADQEGADNAYKTLWLAGGADVKVVGADLKQLDFKLTQGAGETRIAAAGGVPPIMVGLSEGLSAATYSNYGQARRAFGDLWARPQWREAAAALGSVLPAPSGSRLWYDDRHIPFLAEDQRDEAEIFGADAATVRTLTDGGYEPASVLAAVQSRNFSLLKHSGLLSVQMQAPGTTGT